METFIPMLRDFGTESLTIFWLPVAIWTFVALAGQAILKLFEDTISTVYQYHSRVALVWGLAGGILGSMVFHYIPLTLFSEAGTTATFIVIQNPITITASSAAASIDFWNPGMWIGLATAFIFIIAIIALAKLIFDFKVLRSFSKRLPLTHHELTKKLNRDNQDLLQRQKRKVDIHFSKAVSVPCTFGWYHKYIVLPQPMSDSNEKLNMAVRHELTHIANNDYLINATIQSIKALLFFHPLVHKLAANIEEHREMYCDQHVLQDASISQKNYAKLLLELSPQQVFQTTAAVNMAVQPSTLKKRIKTMKNQTTFIPSFKWSFTIMLIFALMLTGLMACSDIEDNGITNSEIEKTQANIDNVPSDGAPLYVINGKVMDQKDIVGKIKPMYIKSIDVLKDKSATDAYGDAGENGVVEITLIDKEKALSDLRTDAEMKALKEKVKRDTKSDGDFFVAVENQPELIGGLKKVQQSVEYPKSCSNAEIDGRVTIQFIVNTEGNVEDPHVIRGIGGGCDEAALKAVKQAQFTPGQQRGKKVRVQMSLPIVFSRNSK